MTRPLFGEFMGTGLLLYVIVASGISAETLGTDPAVQLFAHAIAVGLGLAVLIVMFQTVSGSHFNPLVTYAFWRTDDLDGRTALRYVVVQLIGAVTGVIAANLSFEQSAASISTTTRTGLGLMLSEGIATFVLVLVILGLVRTGRSSAVAVAVGAWVAAIVFATSSTGFANPAVTLARAFTDTYTGIAPPSIPGFLAAQFIAAFAGTTVARVLYPTSDDQ